MLGVLDERGTKIHSVCGAFWGLKVPWLSWRNLIVVFLEVKLGSDAKMRLSLPKLTSSSVTLALVIHRFLAGDGPEFRKLSHPG